jgi:hypothetical protein
MFDEDEGEPRRRPQREPVEHEETFTEADDEESRDTGFPARPAPLRRGARRTLAALAVAVAVLYYPVGMVLTHRINDDTSFAPAAEHTPEGGSRATAMVAALVEREVDDAGWVPNNPFFFASAALDNMPNFQEGLRAAVFRYAIELTDQIGRTRGSSQADEDLEIAAGELKFPGDVWVWNPTISWLPQSTSEERYRRAIRHLRRYNEKLARGEAVFDRRADNLLATLDRFAADLGSASAEIDEHVRAYTGPIDTTADNLFYNVKGRLYGYYMILKELEVDFAEVIAERQLGAAWAKMLDSMRSAAELQPWVVINGAPDGQLLPSHLVAQGFYLLRGRTQLREITNILLK